MPLVRALSVALRAAARGSLAPRSAAAALAAAVLLAPSPAQAADVCYRLPFNNPNLADGWGSTAGGRANPHRGLDFAQAANTPIPAVADGVVRLVTSSGCLGNVVVVEHPDGYFSSYAHLVRRSPLAEGTRVAMGQTVGNVGTTGTCTTGNHLHLTIAPALAGWGSGTTVDPYKFIQARKECSCDRSAGGLTFSCDGANAGKTCVNVNEPADPDSWADNFLCSDDPGLGLAWSSQGPLAGKRCTNVSDAAEKYASAWYDDFVCVAADAPVELTWSNAGPLKDQACVHWNEPADPDSWADNHLCVAPRITFEAGKFVFSQRGPVAGKTCVQLDEPGDTQGWADNFFCSDEDLGIRWSNAGALPGLRCTNLAEPSEHAPAVWADNFVCLPESSPYTFAWSTSGPLPTGDCVRFHESADLAGSWADNYLCVTGPGTGSGAGGVSPDGAAGGASRAGASQDGTDDDEGALREAADEGCGATGASASTTFALVLGPTLLGLALTRRRRRP